MSKSALSWHTHTHGTNCNKYTNLLMSHYWAKVSSQTEEAWAVTSLAQDGIVISVLNLT